ncbi:VOC family protein [Streptomyces sp. SYSU K21746]
MRLSSGRDPHRLTGAERAGRAHGRAAWRDFAAVRHPDDPHGQDSGTSLGRRLLFQRVPEGKTVRNRLHLDLHAGVPRPAARAVRNPNIRDRFPLLTESQTLAEHQARTAAPTA